MTKPPIDRRVARTRATLHQTLMSLIPKWGYEAITIRHICDAANVGRSTFYSHYTSKDDLMRSGIENLRQVLCDRQRDALATPGDIRDRSFGFSLTLFEHARDHIDLHRGLVGGGTVALGIIRQILADVVWDEFTATADKNSAVAVPRELVVQYVVGAYMAVLTWWLDRGAKLPPAEVDRMFRRLAIEGVLHAPHRPTGDQNG
ncbi:MAG: TetR/AcrR family transcriptional regulator [Mesorhizobium sp.]